MIRPLMAEAWGTFMLTLASLGAAQHALGGAGGLLALSLVVGLALCVLISLTIPVSGGHINPAITLLFALRGEIAPGLALAYVAAQIAAACAAVLVMHGLWGLDLWQLGAVVRSGPAHLLSEVLASMGLAMVVMLGLSALPGQTPAMVGAFAVVALWCLPSGGLQNPAVLVARGLTATAGGIRPEDILPTAGAMALGTVLGWALGRFLTAGRRAG